MQANRSRNQRHIEALRGIACLLLVAYHVIGNDAGHGMHVQDDSDWRLFTTLFMHVRMPLFSFISGYVFSAFIADMPALSSAVVKKLRRIGIPFVVVSSLFYLTFSLVQAQPGDPRVPMWQIYVLPYEHYWYLQATMLIMGALLVAGYLAGRNTRAVLTLLFPIAAIVFCLALTFDPDVFALGSALYLLPYFLLGNLLRIWSIEKLVGDVEPRRLAAIAIFGTALALFFLLDVLDLDHIVSLDFDRQSAFGLAFGISTCLLLFFLRPRFRPLEFIGTYSYTIYLFHVFCTASLRMLILRIAPGTPSIVFFFAALAAGLLMPIALHEVLVRNRWSALLLLGIDKKGAPLSDGSRRAEARTAKTRLEATAAP